MRFARVFFVVLGTSWLGACAGPHGEKPALDHAVERPGAAEYGFTGGYAGATGGGFR